MPKQIFSNNAATTLTVGVNTTFTTLAVLDGSKFPSPTAGDYFVLALVGLNGNGQEATWEVLHCTARSGNTLTVVRAQEDTTGLAWGVGTRLEVRLTAAFANTTALHMDNVANPHGVTAAQVGAQPTLVSGTNIKTVGGVSLLESGDVGSPTFILVKESIVTVAALNIDCSAGGYFTKTINGASTFTFANAPAAVAYAFTLELTHTSGAVTWPVAVKWPGDTAPTLTTGKTHLFTFITDDGGTRWRGVAQLNYVN